MLEGNFTTKPNISKSYCCFLRFVEVLEHSGPTGSAQRASHYYIRFLRETRQNFFWRNPKRPKIIIILLLCDCGIRWIYSPPRGKFYFFKVEASEKTKLGLSWFFAFYGRMEKINTTKFSLSLSPLLIDAMSTHLFSVFHPDLTTLFFLLGRDVSCACIKDCVLFQQHR